MSIVLLTFVLLSHCGTSDIIHSGLIESSRVRLLHHRCLTLIGVELVDAISNTTAGGGYTSADTCPYPSAIILLHSRGACSVIQISLSSHVHLS